MTDRRAVHGLTVETRRAELRFEAGAAGGPRRLAGRAAVYNRVTDLGAFRERIAPNAFAETLNALSAKGEGVSPDGADVLALLDHDASKVLGRTKAGTLRLADSAAALEFEIDAPDTGAGRDAMALAMRGDLGGASIGFIVEEERVEKDDAGEVRVIIRAELLEISVVSAWPAYADTKVEARRTVFAPAARPGPTFPAPRSSPRLDALKRYLDTVRE